MLYRQAFFNLVFEIAIAHQEINVSHFGVQRAVEEFFFLREGFVEVKDPAKIDPFGLF